jgi:NAD-dependent deacetylase
MNQENIERAKTILALSRSITVLTGAGISAESGIPTYRDTDGLWNKYRAEDFSSVEAFKEDPVKVWQWYHARRTAMAQAEPNPAHKALTELEAANLRFRIFTQNIDGLHQRAGSRSVTELHGSVWQLRCTKCEAEWEQTGDLQGVPRCVIPECGEIARPAVIWFGESLNPDVWIRAQLATKCDTFLIVGTSASVDPVARLVPNAQAHRAKIIEVNLEPSGISKMADISLFGKAGEILPQLIVTEPLSHDMQLQEMDLGKAMQRGMEKFYAKFPDFRPKME